MLKEDNEAINCSMRNVNLNSRTKFMDVVPNRNVTSYKGCCWHNLNERGGRVRLKGKKAAYRT